MIGEIPVASLQNTMRGETVTGLQSIIRGAESMLAMGLTGTPAQNEINRIQAAANELESRGFYNDAAPLAKKDDGLLLLLLVGGGLLLL